MKKWQLTVTIVLLLAFVAGLNALADYRQQSSEVKAKAAEKARLDAEAKAAAEHPPDKAHVAGPAAFLLPPNSGPATAPVKLEVFIDNSNTCHQPNVGIVKDVQKTYGKLLRVEWFSMMKPEVKMRSDQLNIGCEAGFLINGKIEAKVDHMGGKVLVSFRGTAGDKFKPTDIFAAINSALGEKGKPVPAAAVAKAKGVGAPTVGQH